MKEKNQRNTAGNIICEGEECGIKGIKRTTRMALYKKDKWKEKKKGDRLS